MRSCALFAVEPEEVAGIARDLDFAGLSCQARTFDDGVPEARVDMACVWIGADVQGALAFCQVLRKEEAMKHVPVLALVRAEHLREIFLRENVFDDFIVVPYQTPELEARVRQLLIRTRQGDEGEQLAFGPLEINLATYQVHVAGEPVDLTYMEYELLKFLATHRGRVFTRQALLSRVWGYDYFGGTRTVDVHVRRLRAKLGEHANVIQTVRNVGYKFAL